MLSGQSKRVSQRDRRAEQRREQLIDIALQLFAQHGFDGTSIKDLAEAAGVAQGLVYHYFRSKEDLLLAAVERRTFRLEMRSFLEALPNEPVEAVLKRIAREFAALTAERTPLVRVIAREAQINPRVAQVLESAIQEAVGLLAAFLEKRIDAGDLRPHDPSVTARTLFYMVVMLHLTNVPSQDFLPALVDSLVYGISARG